MKIDYLINFLSFLFVRFKLTSKKKKGWLTIYNKRYFSRKGKLKQGKIYLDLLVSSMLYLTLLFVFIGSGLAQAIIELMWYISIAFIMISPFIMDMMSGTRKINKWMNDELSGFKFKETDYPISLIRSLSNGYYDSPNGELLSKISCTFSGYKKKELNQTIWELQYHLKKEKFSLSIFNLFITCITILGLKELAYKYLSDSISNSLTWLIISVMFIFILSYYIQVKHKKKSFLSLLESIAINEKENRT